MNAYKTSLQLSKLDIEKRLAIQMKDVDCKEVNELKHAEMQCIVEKDQVALLSRYHEILEGLHE